MTKSAPFSLALPRGPTLRKHVVLADDDDYVRQPLVMFLERAGFLVTPAQNGRQALASVQREAPALVVTDIMMPDMDGLELLRAMRRIAPQVPIIAISGGGVMKSELALQAAKLPGACHVLRKPFTGQDLVALVRLLSGSDHPDDAAVDEAEPVSQLGGLR